MKKNDTGDFSVLFVEQEDERNALFQVIAGQQKPVVLILAEQTRVFQRPDDFTTLKLMKRRHDLTITFVIPHGGRVRNWRSRMVSLSIRRWINLPMPSRGVTCCGNGL